MVGGPWHVAHTARIKGVDYCWSNLFSDQPTAEQLKMSDEIALRAFHRAIRKTA
jgi:hypothetical protein